jgi:hypothetical protein
LLATFYYKKTDLRPLASKVEAEIFLFGVAESDRRLPAGLLSPEK